MPIVFVVDDDVSVRAAPELLVPSSGWEVETLRRRETFFARSPALVSSCLILDVGLPDINGLELHKHVASNRPETPRHRHDRICRRPDERPGGERRSL
jgi:FixJ family two-component response regulator